MFAPTPEEVVKTVTATYTNETDGLKSYVSFGIAGYWVSVKDTDAGEFVGHSKNFMNEAMANDYALACVGGGV